MKESVTVSGLPRAHIVSQTSPTPAHPSDEPQQAGIRQGEAAAIGRDDSAVDRFRPAGEAGHPALRRQPVSPSDEHAEHAAVLDPDEDRDRRGEDCDADREPPCRRSRVMGLAWR